MMKRCLVWVVGAAAASLVGCGGGGEKPNVVLVVVDSLRADALGAYGQALPASPRRKVDARNASPGSHCQSNR